MKKLNFGCGTRVADGWINIDFHSGDSKVNRVNLLKGFPYQDASFDVVYSSHVLEHFTPEQALFLLRESYRVLKPGGIIRIVVPDLAGSCKEYLRILDLPDNDVEKLALYEWITIELLDQLVRSRAGGEMGSYLVKNMNGENKDLADYVRSRMQNTPLGVSISRVSLLERLRSITIQKVMTKLTYIYLSIVKTLVPSNLRSMVFVETGIGERHRWMYDAYGLSKICERSGFSNCVTLSYNQSKIMNFNQSCLDCNPDGSPYKNNSVYLEATK